LIKNLLIAILAALSGSLLLENQPVCTQLAPCLWLQGLLHDQEVHRQQQVEAIMSRIRLLQGHPQADQWP